MGEQNINDVNLDPSLNEVVTNLRHKALNLRRHMVRQASGKGEGYLGQGLGIADFLAAMYFYEFEDSDIDFSNSDRKRFYLSTGHYSLALWAVFAEVGIISPDMLDSYGADESKLEMSTMEGNFPGVEMTGGSLGHGLGIAVGAALGYKMDKKKSSIHVEISDGELQEGSTWEAANTASAFGLNNLTCWIDCNGIQADGPMVVPIEPVSKRFESFGWLVKEIDGNNLEELVRCFQWAAKKENKPKAIVMRTTPGTGVKRIVNRDRAHFVRIEQSEWMDVAKELEEENVY